MELLINGQSRMVAVEWQGESLLMVLREHLGLTGAKFGCGVGSCGACTVLVDGVPVRACLIDAAAVANRVVRTIEGLGAGGALHPVQQAWLDEGVAQCGFCQAGQMMVAVSLLERVVHPSDADIDSALAGNLCRCGTQRRIRRAVHRASGASA